MQKAHTVGELKATGYATRAVKDEIRANLLRKLAVVWGVESIHIPLPTSTDAIIRDAIDALLDRRRIRIGDTVIITAGVPAGTAGNTNLILTQVVK